MKPAVETLFGTALCARALRWLARQTAEGHMIEQATLVRHFHALGGKAQFTYAFGRFCSDGRYTRRGFHWIERTPHPERAQRTKHVSWSPTPITVPGRNVVRWVGPLPAAAVAFLSDAALQRTFETLERLATSISPGMGAIGSATEFWWLDIVQAEIAMRATHSISRAA